MVVEEKNTLFTGLMGVVVVPIMTRIGRPE